MPKTTVGELAAVLSRSCGTSTIARVASLNAHRAGGVAAGTRLYVGALVLDSDELLTDSPVRDGSPRQPRRPSDVYRR